MFVTKLKIAAVMLLVIGAAAGGVLTQARTAAPEAEAKAENPPPKAAGGDKKKDAETIAVRVVRPKKGKLANTIQVVTRTDVAQRQQLVPLVSGTVQAVAVDIGDHVNRGQVLIALDAPLMAKDVEQAAAALEMAQAQCEEAEATVTEAQREIKKGIGSNYKFHRAQAALKAARANVKLAQVALDKARIQESFTRLRAEFDGVVSERNCDPGNFVQSGANGTRKRLLTLVRLDRIRVVVNLRSHDVSIIERGDPVELIPVLQRDPKGFITGKIAHISPIVNPQSNPEFENERSVVIDVPNRKNRLVPGESVGVRIDLTKHLPDALIVPSQCVVADEKLDEEFVVFIFRDGKAHRTPIRARLIGDKNAEIVEGIQASDLVITNNQGELSEGTPVKIEKAP